MDSSEQFRLFIALLVPEEVKGAIEKAQQQLREILQDRSIRWPKRDQFHLTLRFLGNVPVDHVEPLIEAICGVCRTISCLHLRATGVGFFPNARVPRVLWAGVSDRDQRLAQLWRGLQTATQGFTREPSEKDFVGHVTMARMGRLNRAQTQTLLTSCEKFKTKVYGEWTSPQVELMRSELLPTGARHTSLAACPLLGT